jgi:hypothetical protein
VPTTAVCPVVTPPTIAVKVGLAAPPLPHPAVELQLTPPSLNASTPTSVGFAPLLEAPGAVYIPPSPGGAIIARKFRTKLCQHFLNRGMCPFECRCMFAHGLAGLRSAEQNFAEGLTSEAAIKEFQRREAQAQHARESGCTAGSDDASTAAVAAPQLPTGKPDSNSGSRYCVGAAASPRVPLNSLRSICQSLEDHEEEGEFRPSLPAVPLHLSMSFHSQSSQPSTHPSPTLIPLTRPHKDLEQCRRGVAADDQQTTPTKSFQHNPYSWTFIVQQQCER